MEEKVEVAKKQVKPRKPRTYCMVQVNREEKEKFRVHALKSDLTVSKWFRGLAYRDMGKK